MTNLSLFKYLKRWKRWNFLMKRHRLSSTSLEFVKLIVNLLSAMYIIPLSVEIFLFSYLVKTFNTSFVITSVIMMYCSFFSNNVCINAVYWRHSNRRLYIVNVPNVLFLFQCWKLRFTISAQKRFYWLFGVTFTNVFFHYGKQLVSLIRWK